MTIKITFYPGVPVDRPRAIGEVRSFATLDAAVDAVLDAGIHDPDALKGAAGYVVAAPVPGPRSNAAARPTRVVALDYDDSPSGPDWTELNRLRCFAYTTDSHLEEAPRWRVWVELDREYTADEVSAAACPWPGCYLRAISQPVYLPTKADDVEWFRGTGAPLALSAWTRPELPAPAEWTPPARKTVPSQASTNALVTRWLSRPEGTNRLAGATGAALAEWGWEDDEIRGYVETWVGAADSRWRKHADDAVRGARRRRAGDRMVGFPTLAEELGQDFAPDAPAADDADFWAALAPDADAPPVDPADDSDAPRLLTADDDGWVTAGAVAAWNPPPIPWLVEGLGLAPGAPVLVSGYGGSGKTTFVQHLALAVATPGARLLGELPVRHGSVTHLDYEQGADLTARRYRSLGLDARAALRFRSAPPAWLDPNDADAKAWLARAAVGQALVVVDSLVAGLGPALDDENAATVRAPLDWLGRLSTATGAVVLVIHHSKKDRSNGRTSARGSSAITDAVSCHLTLEKDDAAVLRSSPVLSVQKLRHEAPRGFIGWEPFSVETRPRGPAALGGYTLTMGDSADALAEASAEAAILTELASGEAVTQETLRKKLALRRDTMKAAVEALEARGLVSRAAEGLILADAPNHGALTQGE